MSYSISYEWTVECIGEHGDIVDLDFYDDPDAMLEAVVKSLEVHTRVDFGLIKYIGIEGEGVVERGYAYVTDGNLPTEFDNGHKVPAYLLKKMDKAWSLHAER